ncbi:MAG: membrane lipoprotein lipid attachment site-containing protein [Colwellia sp.]|nr:membrane lipoprotein lipid attachment site-containing protein [Colwellia sp.]MCW8864254.1 membrane lipoprotein lipid attachment site-containing protein [Colwellia sp.]MCW9082393.1 membrane lipoprotein lipid attachment site-containing protein [Colwellia sp.]
MKKILFVLLSVFALAACKSTPVYNVGNSQVPAGLSSKQVEKNIVKALIQKGWQVKNKTDGKILAEIMVRSHTAKIEISYDASQYSINYVDSTNLKYDAQKNTIHKNYNNWIIYIDRLIQTGLVEESYKN